MALVEGRVTRPALPAGKAVGGPPTREVRFAHTCARDVRAVGLPIRETQRFVGRSYSYDGLRTVGVRRTCARHVRRTPRRHGARLPR